jgi:hypothetical protein
MISRLPHDRSTLTTLEASNAIGAAGQGSELEHSPPGGRRPRLCTRLKSRHGQWPTPYRTKVSQGRLCPERGRPGALYIPLQPQGPSELRLQCTWCRRKGSPRPDRPSGLTYPSPSPSAAAPGTCALNPPVPCTGAHYDGLSACSRAQSASRFSLKTPSSLPSTAWISPRRAARASPQKNPGTWPGSYCPVEQSSAILLRCNGVRPLVRRIPYANRLPRT